ncbi:zinc metalloprotease [Cyclospora cayetanensis]|uniref:Zinc metalloprotease n=1 Tax=Cyclospora cayetanensis TaxID=88456 RepID=A0A1D3CUZ7_9EIME|nr:zinc metalloprotease [Cyclospora cayetanensis]
MTLPPVCAEPTLVEEEFASSASPLTDYVSVSWVLNPCIHAGEATGADTVQCPELSQEVRLALVVLEELLVGTTASPLYKALMDKKLGTAVLPESLELELKHAFFTAGLKGVHQEEGMVQRIEAVILECLSDLSVSGFSPAAIDAALNTVEFRRREFPRGRTLPRGLMFTRLMAADMNYHRVNYKRSSCIPLRPRNFSHHAAAANSLKC